MNYLKNYLVISTRNSSTAAQHFVNRNPRNLERMCIARKPDGYHLEKPGRKFWHKLIIETSNRTISAQVIHYINGPVVQAKTSEWALKKQLFSIKDTCAFINLGRVLAQRCLESGITEVYSNIEAVKGSKLEKLLNAISEGGVKLEEPERYVKPKPWDLKRPAKPWEATEE